MASVINEWLKPPVFPEDENKTRVAHILHVILVVILGGTLVFAVFMLGFIHTGIQDLVFLIFQIFEKCCQVLPWTFLLLGR